MSPIIYIPALYSAHWGEEKMISGNQHTAPILMPPSLALTHTSLVNNLTLFLLHQLIHSYFVASLIEFNGDFSLTPLE